MRIINKQEFYKMPAGTLYSEFEPDILNNLLVKGQTFYNGKEPIDYLECSLIDCIDCNEHSNILTKADNDSNFSFDFNYDNFGRNGIFDEDQKYMVYEKKDVEKLIEFLKGCL